nr:FRG domain-containing protein [uncultured Carboxylicivirga sp.]
MTKSINSINELLTKIESIKKDNPDKELYFRGQIADYGNIRPSIARNGWLQKEDEMFKDFILRNPQDFKDCKTTFEKLAKMQHYSLPTRLLDITSDPLAALYFALESQEYEKFKGGKAPKGINEKNALLIIYAIPKENVKHYDSDTISVVANVARRPYYGIDLKKIRRGASLLFVKNLEGDLKYVESLNSKYSNNHEHESYDEIRKSLTNINKQLTTARDSFLQYHETYYEATTEEEYFNYNIKRVNDTIAELYKTLTLLPPIGNYDEAAKEYEYRNKNYLITAINSQSDIQYLLHEIKEDKPYFKDLINIDHLQTTWCVKPLMNNRRIINQSGAFLLFGIGDSKEELSNDMEYVCQEFSIPVRVKDRLRLELKNLDINKAKIYPELDKVAEYLRDIYSK